MTTVLTIMNAKFLIKPSIPSVFYSLLNIITYLTFSINSGDQILPLVL